jgi:hypothetical protein
MRFSELIPVLQFAVAPVILISGVGLLLLSMTNRFGRVIDRARLIAEARRKSQPSELPRFASQLKTLQRRADLLRLAITLSVISVLLAAFLVITVFITALAKSDVALPIVILFLACLVTLIFSLVVFLQDLNLSLEAMTLEVGQENTP